MERGVGGEGKCGRYGVLGLGLVPVFLVPVSDLFRGLFVSDIWLSLHVFLFSCSVSLPQMHGSYVAWRGTER